MSNFTGNAELVSLGAGIMWEAPVGTTLPTDLADALDAAFKQIGYTADGSQFSYQIQTAAVEAAESYDPLTYRTTGRSGNVTFAMLENTAKAMTRAFNGGTVIKTTSGAVKYTPPEVGSEVRRALVWESEDGEERWVFPQVFQSGSVAMVRKKGADKVTIPVQFDLEKPSSGGAPFEVYYAAARDGDTGALDAA